MAGSPEPPLKRVENGTELADINVLLAMGPWEGHDVTPMPPLGRDGLPRVETRVPRRRRKAKVVTPMRLSGMKAPN